MTLPRGLPFSWRWKLARWLLADLPPKLYVGRVPDPSEGYHWTAFALVDKGMRICHAHPPPDAETLNQEYPRRRVPMHCYHEMPTP